METDPRQSSRESSPSSTGVGSLISSSYSVLYDDSSMMAPQNILSTATSTHISPSTASSSLSHFVCVPSLPSPTDLNQQVRLYYKPNPNSKVFPIKRIQTLKVPRSAVPGLQTTGPTSNRPNIQYLSTPSSRSTGTQLSPQVLRVHHIHHPNPAAAGGSISRSLLQSGAVGQQSTSASQHPNNVMFNYSRIKQQPLSGQQEVVIPGGTSNPQTVRPVSQQQHQHFPAYIPANIATLQNSGSITMLVPPPANRLSNSATQVVPQVVGQQTLASQVRQAESVQLGPAQAAQGAKIVTVRVLPPWAHADSDPTIMPTPRAEDVTKNCPLDKQNPATSFKEMSIISNAPVAPPVLPVSCTEVSVIKPSLTDTIPSERSPKEADEYNRRLLEYVNKTLSKSGNVTMIADREQLNKKIQNASNKLVVIDFFTMGSGACQRIAPQVQHLSLKYKDVIFLKVDVEHTGGAAVEYNIQATPTFLFLRNGSTVGRLHGLDVDELETTLEQLIKAPVVQPAVENIVVQPIEMINLGDEPNDEKKVDEMIAQSVHENTMKHLKTWLGSNRGTPDLDVISDVVERQPDEVTTQDSSPRCSSPDSANGEELFLANQIRHIFSLDEPKKSEKNKKRSMKGGKTTEATIVENNKGKMVSSAQKRTRVRAKKSTTGRRRKKVPSPEKPSLLKTSTTTQPGNWTLADQANHRGPLKSMDDDDFEVDVVNVEDRVEVTSPQMPRTSSERPNIAASSGTPGTDSFWRSIQDELEDDFNPIIVGTTTLAGMPGTPSPTKMTAESPVEPSNVSPPKMSFFKRLQQKPSKNATFSASGMSKTSTTFDPRELAVQPVKAKTSKSSKAIVTRKLYEDTEDTLLGKKPNKTVTCKYFSISSRPPLPSTSIDMDDVDDIESCDENEPPGDSPSKGCFVLLLRDDKGKTNSGSKSAPPKPSRSKNGTAKSSSSGEEAVRVLDCEVRLDSVKGKRKADSQSDRISGGGDPKWQTSKRFKAASQSATRSTDSAGSDVNGHSLKYDGSVVILKDRWSKPGYRHPTRNLVVRRPHQISDCSVVLMRDPRIEDVLSEGHSRIIVDRKTWWSSPRRHRIYSRARKNFTWVVNMDDGRKKEYHWSKDINRKPALSANESYEYDTADDVSIHSTSTSEAEEEELVVEDSEAEEDKSEDEEWQEEEDVEEEEEAEEENLDAEEDSEENEDSNGEEFEASDQNDAEDKHFECVKCGKTFMLRSSLLRHVKQHRGLKRFNCPTCDRIYFTAKSLEKHKRQKHPKLYGKKKTKSNIETDIKKEVAMVDENGDSLQCETCRKVFINRASLWKHTNTYHPDIRTFACTTCHMKFFSIKSLQDHRRSKHDVYQGRADEKQCPKCWRSFATTLNLQRHIRESHEEDAKIAEELKCKKCGLEFGSKQSLTKHMPLCVQVFNFECRICYRQYFERGNLARHMRTYHNTNITDRPVEHECKVCLKPTGSSTNFECHMQDIHKIEMSPEAVQRYECEMCTRIFNDQGNLARHMESVHQIQNFACEKCSRVFSDKSSLGRHMNSVHLHGMNDSSMSFTCTIKKTHECEKCTLRFKDKYTLERHLQSFHRSIPGKSSSAHPYECMKCRRPFAMRSTLRSHLWEAHQIKLGFVPETDFKKCLKCDRKFNSDEGLKQHVKLAHSESVVVKILEPKTEETSSDIHKCQICGKVFGSKRNVLRHLETVHKKNKMPEKQTGGQSSTNMTAGQYECMKCKRPFLDRFCLRAHLRRVHKVTVPTGSDRKHECPKCTWRFARRYQLKKHMFNLHQMDVDSVVTVRRFRCAKCSGTFLSSSSAHRHLAQVHRVQHTGKFFSVVYIKQGGDSQAQQQSKGSSSSGDKPQTSNVKVDEVQQTWDCRSCSKKFRERKYLVKHIQGVHKTREIALTGKTWEAAPAQSKKHVQSSSNKRPDAKQALRCRECGKQFNSRRNMLRHLRRVHDMFIKYKTDTPANETNTEVEETEADDEEQALTCRECDIEFMSRDSLLRHMRNKHNIYISRGNSEKKAETEVEETEADDEEQALTCRECDQQFMSRNNLLRHMRNKHDIYISRGDSQKKAALEVEQMDRNDDDQALTCRECDKEFGRREKLLRHMRNVHKIFISLGESKSTATPKRTTSEASPKPTSKPRESLTQLLKCEKCPQKFIHFSSLIRHMKIHAEDKMYSCTECGKKYYRLENFDRHLALHNNKRFKFVTKSKPSTTAPIPCFPCTICGKKYTRRDVLQGHMTKSHNSPGPTDSQKLRCDVCAATFSRVEILERHRETHKEKLMCDKCGEEFPGAYKLHQHVLNDCKTVEDKRAPEEEKEFECHECGATYSNLDTLGRHTKALHINAHHVCATCGARFTKITSLKFHKKVRHSIVVVTTPAMMGSADGVGPSSQDDNGDVDLSGPEDGAASDNTKQRRRSSRTTTGDDEASQDSSKEQSTNDPQPAGDGKYHCDRCEALFSAAKSLRQHIKKQHISIRFHCQHCSAGFSTSQYFKLHSQRAHGNAKAESQDKVTQEELVCEQCGESYPNAAKLERHVRYQHTTINHRCPHCNAGFFTAAGLTQHVEKFHMSESLKPPQIKEDGEVLDSFKLPVVIADSKVSVKREVTEGYEGGEITNVNTECEECGAKFTLESSLRKHQNNQHREVAFTCDICQAGFRTKKNLKYHGKKQHGVDLVEPVAVKKENLDVTETEDESERIGDESDSREDKDDHFRCEECSAIFSRQENLTRHTRQQHMRASLPCSICHARFRTKKYLHFHRQTQHQLDMSVKEEDTSVDVSEMEDNSDRNDIYKVAEDENKGQSSTSEKSNAEDSMHGWKIISVQTLAATEPTVELKEFSLENEESVEERADVSRRTLAGVDKSKESTAETSSGQSRTEKPRDRKAVFEYLEAQIHVATSDNMVPVDEPEENDVTTSPQSDAVEKRREDVHVSEQEKETEASGLAVSKQTDENAAMFKDDIEMNLDQISQACSKVNNGAAESVKPPDTSLKETVNKIDEVATEDDLLTSDDDEISHNLIPASEKEAEKEALDDDILILDTEDPTDEILSDNEAQKRSDDISMADVGASDPASESASDPASESVVEIDMPNVKAAPKMNFPKSAFEKSFEAFLSSTSTYDGKADEEEYDEPIPTSDDKHTPSSVGESTPASVDKHTPSSVGGSTPALLTPAPVDEPLADLNEKSLDDVYNASDLHEGCPCDEDTSVWTFEQSNIVSSSALNNSESCQQIGSIHDCETLEGIPQPSQMEESMKDNEIILLKSDSSLPGSSEAIDDDDDQITRETATIEGYNPVTEETVTSPIESCETQLDESSQQSDALSSTGYEASVDANSQESDGNSDNGVSEGHRQLASNHIPFDEVCDSSERAVNNKPMENQQAKEVTRPTRSAKRVNPSNDIGTESSSTKRPRVDENPNINDVTSNQGSLLGANEEGGQKKKGRRQKQLAPRRCSPLSNRTDTFDETVEDACKASTSAVQNLSVVSRETRTSKQQSRFEKEHFDRTDKEFNAAGESLYTVSRSRRSRHRSSAWAGGNVDEADEDSTSADENVAVVSGETRKSRHRSAQESKRTGRENLIANSEDSNTSVVSQKIKPSGHGHPRRSSRHTTRRKQKVCRDCGKTCRSKDHLRCHRACHSSARPFMCPTCGKHFIHVTVFNLHILSHVLKYSIECEICGLRFLTERNRTIHSQHHLSRHRCKLCGKTFSCRQRLKAHQMNHDANRPHQCAACGKSIAKSFLLKLHMIGHIGEPHTCETCSRTFSTSAKLRAHERKHKLSHSSHRCLDCGKSFTSKFVCLYHAASHTTKLPYRCNDCGKNFRWLHSLKSHMKNCH